MRKVSLSIVIVSYNTKALLSNCLSSLEQLQKELDFEVIVVDNASSDNSSDLVIKRFKWVKLVQSTNNLGFSGGNNLARKHSKGKYILFLNSDTVVPKNTLKRSLEYLEKHKNIGALTCKMVMKNGELDVDARRSFPTPWVSITHLVLKIDRVFPKSKLFAKYWYGYISPNETHEIDVAQGAYIMSEKKVLDQINWFDEEYFLDGEDVDLCWRIKEKGYKIIYYPKVEIVHVKKASKKKLSKEMRMKFVTAGANSMELFYKKHMWNKYPLPLNVTVIVGVKVMKYMRIVKTLLT